VNAGAGSPIRGMVGVAAAWVVISVIGALLM